MEINLIYLDPLLISFVLLISLEYLLQYSQQHVRITNFFGNFPLFQKITLVILMFALISYLLTQWMVDKKYSAQDTLWDYQSLVLHQKVAQNWHPLIEQDSIIMSDLQAMKLSGYVTIYNDLNKNQVLDLHLDTLINIWTNKMM